MSQPTHKSLTHRTAVVVHPHNNGGKQRVVSSFITRMEAHAVENVARARRLHPGKPLGFLDMQTGEVTPIPVLRVVK